MTLNWLTPVLAGALGVALLNLGVNIIKWMAGRWHSTRPEIAEQRRVHQAVAQADESMLVVVRARDQLEDDNARIRDECTRDRTRYDADRAEWRAERDELRAEIARLRGKAPNA